MATRAYWEYGCSNSYQASYNNQRYPTRGDGSSGGGGPMALPVVMDTTLIAPLMDVMVIMVQPVVVMMVCQVIHKVWAQKAYHLLKE